MIIAGAEDLIDNIAVVGQQNKPFGVLIEAPDGENALAVTDEIDDIVGIPAVCGADYAAGLVKGDQYEIFIAIDLLALKSYRLAGKHLASHESRLTVDRDEPGFYRGICLASGTDARIGEKLVDPDASGLIGRGFEHVFFCFHISPFRTASLHSLMHIRTVSIISFRACNCKQSGGLNCTQN